MSSRATHTDWRRLKARRGRWVTGATEPLSEAQALGSSARSLVRSRWSAMGIVPGGVPIVAERLPSLAQDCSVPAGMRGFDHNSGDGQV